MATKTSKKTTAKKQKKTEETIQETKETEMTPTMENSPTPTEEVLPKRYYVQIWKKIRPTDSRFDAVVGSIYWSDTQQDIVVEQLSPAYAADIRSFLKSDIRLPHGVFVSQAGTPKEWVRNLHLALLTNNFYATQFMEIIDETE